MSAKRDFAKAREHVEAARRLTTKHFKPGSYPGTFNHFTRLLDTLNRLSILGVRLPSHKND